MSIHSTGVGDDNVVVLRRNRGAGPQPVPRFVSIDHWVAVTSVKRTTTFALIAKGILRAHKLGARTLIDLDHGLAMIAALPAPVITTGLSRRKAATTAEAETVASAARPQACLGAQ
jgi:hypothetical protein